MPPPLPRSNTTSPAVSCASAVGWGAVLWWRKRLESTRLFLMAAVAMGPAGFVAVISGWVVAEVGRQPWVVTGVLRTADAVSPVTAGQVSVSLVSFMVVYAVIFSAGAVYILRLIGAGPAAADDEPDSHGRPPGSALGALGEGAP